MAESTDGFVGPRGWVRSNLLLDCIPITGRDSAPQCFTLGNAKPQECATGKEYSSQTIVDLLAASGGTDGYMGSVCNVTAGQNNSVAVQVPGSCRCSHTALPAGCLSNLGMRASASNFLGLV